MVLVKLNGKNIYCDPGAAFTPFGLLPWTETSVAGRRLDKDGGEWVQTDLPESSASRIVRTANLKLSAETGGLEGKLTLTFTGLEAMRRRTEERNQDDTERKIFLEDEVKQYIPAASEVELTKQPNWKSSDPSLVAESRHEDPRLDFVRRPSRVTPGQSVQRNRKASLRTCESHSPALF